MGTSSFSKFEVKLVFKRVKIGYAIPFFLIFVNFTQTVFLQNVKKSSQIKGRILTEKGFPISGAKVKVILLEKGYSLEASTDLSGFYKVVEIPVGEYQVEVTSEGFIAERKIITIGETDHTIEVNFILNARLEKTFVKGVEERNPNKFISKIDLNVVRDELRRNPLKPIVLEFTAIQPSFGAEFNTPLRQIILVQPTNPRADFHGSAYWAHQNSIFNARPFFNVGPLRHSHSNEFGFSSSGSLFNKRVFLLGSADFLKSIGNVNGNIRVPLPKERIPQSGDSATDLLISALLSGYPNEQPNMPGVLERQLNTNSVRQIDSQDVRLRSDISISEKNIFGVQYAVSDLSENPFELVAGENPITKLRPQSLSMTDVHNISPNTTIQGSFYFDRLRAHLLPTEWFRSLLGQVGLSDVPDIDFGGNRADLSSLGPGKYFPRKRYQNRFVGNFGVATSIGRHQIKWGGSLVRAQINDLQSDNSRGKFVFSNNFGRTAIENFLYGTPTKFTITLGDLYRGFRHWESSVYFDDNFRVASNLTVNVGLRYEMITSPQEVNELTQFGYKADSNNFAPQIGFAWSPDSRELVIRGGYGVSFGQISPATYQIARFNPPEVRTISVQNPNMLDPLKDIDLDSSTQKSELNLLSPDLVSPYAHQYGLTIQKKYRSTMFEVGYVGNRTHKLFFPYVSNRAESIPGIPSTTGTINERRPDPRYLSIKTIINSGTFYYDALKFGIHGQDIKGLTVDMNYIFSKALSSGYEFFNTLNAESSVALSQNNVDFHADLKGPSELDGRHTFLFNTTYEIPSWSPFKADWLFYGWRITTSYKFRTGNWFKVNTSSDAPGFGNVDGEGDDRPNLLNPSIIGAAVDHPDTVSSIFNPEFFDTNLTPGGRGNIGLRVFRKDALNNINLTLRKSFELEGNLRMGFRTDFYNLLNHPQFERPGDVVPSLTFGKIVDTQNKGRVLQFALEFNF